MWYSSLGDGVKEGTSAFSKVNLRRDAVHTVRQLQIFKERKKRQNKATFKALERKLNKKNAELNEVLESRKKLDDKEKEICVAIEKLQAQKIEIIFDEIKREVRSDKLDVSSSTRFCQYSRFCGKISKHQKYRRRKKTIRRRCHSLDYFGFLHYDLQNSRRRIMA